MHDLCAWGFTFVISGYKTQYVFMAEHGSLIDLSLAEPGSLLSGRKDLHRHVAASPAPAPHLSKATFPNDFLENDGPGHGPLDKQRQTCSKRDKRTLVWFKCLLENINGRADARVCSPEPEPEVDRSNMRSCRVLSLAG